jgi:vesicle-fusing ATPase
MFNRIKEKETKSLVPTTAKIVSTTLSITPSTIANQFINTCHISKELKDQYPDKKYISIRFQDREYISRFEVSETCHNNSIEINKLVRDFLGIKKREETIILYSIYDREIKYAKEIEIDVCKFDSKQVSKKIIKHETLFETDLLKDYIVEFYHNYCFHNTERLIMPYNLVQLQLDVKNMDIGALSNCLINKDTKIIFSGAIREKKIFKIDKLAFDTLGVGGIDDQLDLLYKEVFMSREMSENEIEKYGLKHVKGIILYGPPGCGKTLLASSFGKILNCEEPIITNGPELLDKWVGGSQKNLRDKFQIAYDNPDKLYLYIFDEFDALFKARGSGDSSGVNDSMVNQILTIMDGYTKLNNIIVIGMTNRKDLLDSAMTRAGRFEVHIEIKLPNEIGRKQILQIHTAKLRENNLLDAIDLDEIIKKTENFTGAEIKKLVDSSVKNAVIEDKKRNTNNKNNLVKITQSDFDTIIDQIVPQFGSSNDLINEVLSVNEFTCFDNSDYHRFVEELKSTCDSFKINTKSHVKSLILHGQSGNSKTYLACYLAKYVNFKFTKIISAKSLIRNKYVKNNKIIDTFDDAEKSENSVIIIDDIENIIEYTRPNYINNEICQTLRILMSNFRSFGKLLIIGTTNNYEDLKDKGLFDKIDNDYEVPLLDGITVKQYLETV